MRQLVPHYTGSILTTSVLAINTVAPHLLNRRSQEWLSASVLSICSFVCLSPKCKKKTAIFSKTKQFRAMVPIDDL